MQKRLITKDYEEIVLESLKIPESDFHNYYLNIVEENYSYNNDIIFNLKKAVNQWINWYNSKIYGKQVRVKMPDGTISIEDENQAWTTDEKGNMTPIDLEKTLLPLIIDFGINRHVDKAFFDNLLDELNRIQTLIDFKKKVVKFEKDIPELLKKEIPKKPISEGFNHKELKERFELLKKINTKEIAEKEIQSYIKDKEKWLINNQNIFNLPLKEAIPLSIINLGLFREITENKFTNLSEYLNFKIDGTKEIAGTGGYTIQKILLEEINISESNARYLKEHKKEVTISYIYSLIHFWLFKFYSENKHSEFLFIDKYKTEFSKKQSSFLEKNIDTNSKEFIKSEIKICKKILKELKKPIYNNITLLGIEDEFSEFKKNLQNNIKRRLEFLSGINEIKENTTDNKKREKEEIFSKDNIDKFENNLIPQIRLIDVFKYFEILLNTKNKENINYLNEDKLLTFIKSTFVDKKPILQTFNCTLDAKKDIRSLFYRFYEQATLYDYKTKNKKQKYFNILFQAFKGFEIKKDFNEWHKTNNKISSNLNKQP